MSVLTGILKVQCTTELKDEIRKYGKPACVLIMDEIKHMDNVTDVWVPKDKKIDIIVETDASSSSHMDNLKSQILELEGVFQIIPKTSVEIDN